MSELTVAEMVLFIQAQRKHQLEDWEMLAKIGYSGGILGSMALAKKRPSFEEVFTFPRKDQPSDMQIKQHEAKMIAWAHQVNKLYRDAERNRGDEDNG